MRWDDEELQAAALRLLLTRRLRRTKKVAALLDELDEAGIVRLTRRQSEFELEASRESDLRRYLAARWPSYAEVESAFTGVPDAVDAAALRALRRLHLDPPQGFHRLHHKTWAAWAGPHSKAGAVIAPEGLALTVDDVLRVRPSAGMQLRAENGALLDLDALQAVTGEVVLSERAFIGAWTIEGPPPKLVLTIENLGAFVDAPALNGVLMILLPGWNSTLATQFIERLPGSVPWWHFGDIDPNGLKIGHLLRCGGGTERSPGIWIPACAARVLTTHAQQCEQPWPSEAVPPELEGHPLISTLVEEQLWLEQEPLVLLPEFAEELKQLAEMGPGFPGEEPPAQWP